MFLKINPIFEEKSWGGKKFNNFFQDKVNPELNIGEAWLISGFHGNESEIIDSNYDLNQFYKENRLLFNNYPTSNFPLLTKLIITEQNQSVHVHPDNTWAQKLDTYPYGNEEAWYIINTFKFNNKVILGSKINSIRELNNSINKGKWSKIINEEHVRADDVLLIRPGTIHAILKGIVLFQIGQSSELAYNIYDFDRKNENGSLKPLQLVKALDCIQLQSLPSLKQRTLIKSKEFLQISLINGQYFGLEKWILNGKKNLILEKNDYNFLLVTCIKGQGSINDVEIEAWESIVITADELHNIELQGKMILLIGYPS